ncbi:hypothetical protein [Mesorhizobium sp. M1B.F.Ca.ET.045.04.1.1]|uniref:hypothetical protein n=1 Tax=Mesorhizobium sp. M1B.F.Ca.ET.045.04.1.1 TaxID=2493673 RepID=UPI000F7601A2|nr:hypothetical protein [Mesorhizobium sp. M1B.F.Ca.ET.045.04.1.1]AZO29450.1 hypothetical protein EJ071_19995 [Mesorhizobium sp. M1B.F.Ca.ET.045.04.1.1]
MIKAIIVTAILIATPAAAEEMSQSACNALSDAAGNAAGNMNGVINQLGGEAFRNAMPVMPEKAKAPAADVEDARVAAQFALKEYQNSLKRFSASIQNCGQ